MVKLAVFFLLTACIVANCSHHDTRVVIDKLVRKTPLPSFEKINFKSTALRDQVVETLRQLKPRAIVDQNITNSLVDQAVGYLQEGLVKDGFDVVPLPDERADFHYWLIITYFGGIDLTNGHLHGLHTIHRSGNVVLVDDEATDVYTAFVPIEFDDFLVTYDYEAEIMGLGPRGGIISNVRDVHVELIVKYDAANMQLSLIEFEVTGSRHIDVVFTGNYVVDWLLDLLANLVTAILKDGIWSMVDHLVDNAVRDVIEEINDIIKLAPPGPRRSHT